MAHLLKLDALGQFFAGSQFVDRHEFATFIEPLHEMAPDVRMFFWAPRVLDTDRLPFEQAVQAEGFAGFQIYDDLNAEGTVAAPQREEYYPILYCCHESDWTIGSDLFSEPLQHDAIERACDAGQSAATGQVTFPGKSKDRTGILVFRPVYAKGLPAATVEERRVAIEGVVVCAMQVGNILENVIHSLKAGGIDVGVFDVSTTGKERLLCQHWSRLRRPDMGDCLLETEKNSDLSYVASLGVADRTWEIRCTPSPNQYASHTLWTHWIVLVGGLMLTILLLMYLWARQNRTAIVEELVDERTVQLRKSERLLRKSQEIGHIGSWSLDIKKNELVWSDETYRIFGMRPQEFKATYEAFLEAVHLDDRELVSQVYETAIKSKQPYELIHRILRPDGTVRIVHEKSAEIVDESGRPISSVGMVHDITERKLAEEALLIEKEQAQRYLDIVGSMLVALDLNGKITLLNKKGCEVLACSAGEALGKNWFDTFLPERLRTDVAAVFERLMTGDIEPVKYHENPVLTVGGEERLIAWHNSILRDGEGNPIGVLSSGEDITERKQAEEALKESEEKHRALFECSAEGILIADIETKRFKYANPAICEMLRYTQEELEAMGVADIHAEDGLEYVVSEFEAQARGEKTLAQDIPCLRKDGMIIYADISTARVTIDGRECNVGFFTDITETRRLRELESRAKRLEMAGKIAGQVAHDFNNLLSPVMAYPELIRSELPKNHHALAYLSSIETAAGQIAEINQQLLTLGRRGHYNLRPLNINEVVLRAVQELEPLPDTLVCETSLAEDLMNILGGNAQIYRVITNLLHNACDAMQDIGTISIKTENYYADDVAIAYCRVPKGEYVKLTITDTGCGIPDDIIQKIFDPFFTSKVTDKKRGSGLGMSVVDAVVKDHGGYIDMSTKVGEGTSFYLYFPVTRESIEEQDSGKISGGSETILVVDDDEMQRDVSSQLLKKLGYNVTVVESGEKATEFLKENPQDLLVLDMVMPAGIDGTETYRKVLMINPAQKAVIVSGYSETERVLEAQKLGAGAFVKKPLTLQGIAAAVRKELDREVKIVVH